MAFQSPAQNYTETRLNLGNLLSTLHGHEQQGFFQWHATNTNPGRSLLQVPAHPARGTFLFIESGVPDINTRLLTQQVQKPQQAHRWPSYAFHRFVV